MPSTSFTIEKSLAGTDHFVFGPTGSVTWHEADDWEDCEPGWYVHAGKGSHENGDILGPFPSREIAERELLATAL